MNAQHDADRLVHAFLLEGPTEMAPTLAARIRAEVQETRQRAGFRPWRTSTMPRTIWIMAPLAAVIVAVAGLLIAGVGNKPPVAGPTAVPSPTALVSPSAGPTAFPLGAGEAWIVIAGDNGATLVRSDGTGRHEILGSVRLRINDPAWSPDGNRLVFDGNGDSGSHLWLVDADGTNARQLTPTPAGCPNGHCIEAVHPAWSPDGTKIAYVAPEHQNGAFTRTALVVIDVASGTTTEIYGTDQAGLARPTWSPDGQSIALEVDRFEGGVETSAFRDTAIGVVDLLGADHTPTMITEPALLAGFPAWHPMQDLIVFRTNPLDNDTESTLDPEAASDLYTIRSDGSALTRVTSNDVGGDIARAPSWTPDGRILFTSRDRGAGVETLRVINPDGTNEASATGAIDTFGQGRWRPGT